MLAQMLDGIPRHHDDRLIVGYDKSDDASVYVVRDDLAIVQSVDFFPPIVDDPYMFGQIAAANSLSDIFAMGADPKLAMNVMCINSAMGQDAVREILQGGYSKAYEAGVLITGGHTIEDKEPKYGLSVTGFMHPDRLLSNSSAREGDVLLLTKPLGVGILTTAAKVGLVEPALERQLFKEMAELNKYGRDIMIKYDVHSCTDITGFGLMGHAYEMASGSGMTLHLDVKNMPYHPEAVGMAEEGFIPAGAYRNRDYTKGHVKIAGDISEAVMDILYDPQTSGGLMIAVSEKDAVALEKELKDNLPCGQIIGYVTVKEDTAIVVE